MPPTLIEVTQRYWLRDKLGEGGMGEVYAAFDRLTGTNVALKRVLVSPQNLLHSAPNAESVDLRRVLANEFRVLASLRHPHIISVLDYGFDAERFPYYTMTLLEKPRTIIESGQTFTLQESINTFAQMLQALAYLHRRGILHRDLKPGNVLIDLNDSVKLLDFGLATQENTRGSTGTLAYMPPEIIQQGAATRQSDLYSLGIVAYELFAKRYPFDAQAPAELLEQLMLQTPDMDAIPDSVSPIITRLLMKDPADRYGDAEAVLADLAAMTGGAINIEDATVRESYLQGASFVGRERELNLLIQQLDQIITAAESNLRAGGAGFLIGGESGAGKSRLLDELRTHALLIGALVLRGQCVAESGQPFQMWRDVMRRLLLENEVSDLEASILREIVPDISELLQREVLPVPPLTAISAQNRLVETILAVFRRQTQPIVLILEDLHWGLESLIPLRRLAGLCKDLPLLIVGSYRNDEAPTLPTQLPEMHNLSLGRLTHQEIADLSRAMIGATGEHQYLVEYLHKKSEGNVLFLVEVIRALAEDAGNLRSISTMSTLPEQVIAGGIERIITRRLKRLPIEATPTLQLAAVAGRDIDERLIYWLVGEDADRWLQAGMDAAILEVVDAKLRFAHDRLRDAVISMIPNSVMPQYHQSIAEGLEMLYPDNDNLVTVLYDHWRFAGNSEKEAYYAVMVMEQRMLLGILNEASKMLDKVLLLQPQEPQLQLKFYCLAGETYFDLGKSQLSSAAYTNALRLAQQLNQPEIAGIALEGLGNAAQTSSDFDGALVWFEKSLKLRREIGDVRGIASALHVISITKRMLGDYDVSGKALEESLALRRQLDEPRGLSDSLYQISVRARNKGSYTEAIDYLKESLDLRRRTGDARGLGDDLINLGICYTLTGQYELASQTLFESLTLRRAMDNQRGEASCHNAIGELNLIRGQAGIALRHFGLSLDIWQDKADRWNIANCHASVGYAQARAREVYSARHHLHEGLEISQRISALFIVLKSLIGWAQLKLHEQQDYQAAILLGAVDHHPAMTAQLRQVYFDPVIEKLDLTRYAAEYEMGATSDLQGLIKLTLTQAKQYF